jgi:hypothetical protein
MLALVGGLCFVGLMSPVGVVTGVRRQTRSVYWDQLSRFHLKTETESGIRNILFLNKKQDDG